MGNNYSRAYTEVLEILKYLPQKEYDKIPKEKIEFFENNKDKDYVYMIDPEISLSEQNISRKTYAIFIALFKNYFADDNQKILLNRILDLNQAKLEKEKQQKYSPNDIFKNKK